MLLRTAIHTKKTGNNTEAAELEPITQQLTQNWK